MSGRTARVTRLVLTSCACALLSFVGAMQIAWAHPLGNFTINHLAKLSAGGGSVRVRYVLDIAEIPTFQILHARNDGRWNAAMLAEWARAEDAIVLAGLDLRVDGKRQTLSARASQASLRPGAGGLPLLRWVGTLQSPITPGAHHVDLADRVYADRRIGWKDLIAGAQTEPTDELRRYPNALLGSPRHTVAISFVITGAGSISSIQTYLDAQQPASLASWVAPGTLSDLFATSQQTPFFMLFTMLAAFGLGALHGIEPGHGKALLAFTLVGARATARQALTLALSLTFAHTAGVLLLGAALFFAASFVSESIYPWITLVSGAAIAIVGGKSLAGAFSSASHAAHEHGTAPLNFRNAIVAAMSGGIAPCPAAIVVLLAALRLHHVGYGMILIVLFSAGLAAILTAIGIGVVHGAAFLSKTRAYEHFAKYGPLVTASIISVIGACTLAQGFSQQGAPVPPAAVAALALAAIAGYALSRRGGHAHSHSHSHSHYGAGI